MKARRDKTKVKAKRSQPPKAQTPRTSRGPKAQANRTRGPQVLFDLVCDVDGRIAGGLTGRSCLAQARAHNEEHPDHNATCIIK